MLVKELFIPKIRITVQDKEEINKFIQIYNGKKNMYVSVYDYKDIPNAQNAYVDRVFLDFDYDKDLKFYEDVRRVAEYLNNKDYLFFIRFSGRGFHIFIMTKPEESLQQPKLAIKKFVKDLHQRTQSTSDPAVIGDLRRLSRIIGTKNLKTGLYCIPITYEQLFELSYNDICKLAKKNNNNCDYIHGKTRLSLQPFDETKQIISPLKAETIGKIDFSTEFPPCVKCLLSTPDLGYHERRELICYLRDDGYSEEEVEHILEQSLSSNKFYHCIEEEGQLEYLFSRDDILFSSCPTQKANGICCSNECKGQNLYI